MLGTYKGLLLLCECRCGGDSTFRWWGHLNTTCHNGTCSNFLHSEVVGNEKLGKTALTPCSKLTLEHKKNYSQNDLLQTKALTPNEPPGESFTAWYVIWSDISFSRVVLKKGDTETGQTYIPWAFLYSKKGSCSWNSRFLLIGSIWSFIPRRLRIMNPLIGAADLLMKKERSITCITILLCVS